jgi:hypothetical protein
MGLAHNILLEPLTKHRPNIGQKVFLGFSVRRRPKAGYKGDGETAFPSTETTMEQRPLHTIAAEIRDDWTKVYFGAVPYLNAMFSLTTLQDTFGYDTAQSVVLYFLSNATTWRGPVARRVKAELKAMLKEVSR